MRTLKIALLATVAAAAFTSTAMAADLIVDAPPAIYDEAPASYGLDGPYAGVYLLGDSHTSSFGAGVVLGANFVNDYFLLGIEGDLSVTTVPDWYGQVVGKAGFAISEGAAIYGLAGFGYGTHAGAYIPVGLGAEFMMTDSLSLKAQGEYHWQAGGDSLVGKIGLNFHF
jgi:opacity protein-like surface antigen